MAQLSLSAQPESDSREDKGALLQRPSPSESFDLEISEEAHPILGDDPSSQLDRRYEGRTDDEPQAAEVIAKLNRSLMSIFFVLTALCYIDRTNLAFAALDLNADLGFSTEVYGLGSGLFFFLGYVAFQVPGNLAIVRVGGRLWLGMVVTLWGLLAMAFAGLQNATQFYVLRLALGAAESSTMPGMWYVMSLFYTEGELTLGWAGVLIAIAVSQVIGGPLAALFLSCDGFLGLRGWQILFLAEGAAAALAGVYVLLFLADCPLNAKFLKPSERQWLHERNAQLKEAAIQGGAQDSAWSAVRNPKTWHLAAISMLANVPKWGLIFWLPLIVNAVLGGTSAHPASAPLIALLSAVPFGVSALAIYFNSAHSKRTGERHYHVAVPLVVAACGFVVLALLITRTMTGAFAALLVVAVVWAPDAVMASWPATFLQGAGAATGVALINSVGSFGGMIGPGLLGFLAERPTGYALPLLIIAVVAFVVAALALVFPETSQTKEHTSPAASEAAQPV